MKILTKILVRVEYKDEQSRCFWKTSLQILCGKTETLVIREKQYHL